RGAARSTGEEYRDPRRDSGHDLYAGRGRPVHRLTGRHPRRGSGYVRAAGGSERERAVVAGSRRAIPAGHTPRARRGHDTDVTVLAPADRARAYIRDAL